MRAFTRASSALPASAGGALGESLGQLSVAALNVQGSTLLFLALFLLGGYALGVAVMVVLLAVGLVVERWCRIPPEGDAAEGGRGEDGTAGRGRAPRPETEGGYARARD